MHASMQRTTSGRAPAQALGAASWRAGTACQSFAVRSKCSASDHQHTPLLDAIIERGKRSEDVPFHVPGHKRGGSTPPCLHQVLGAALRYDLTELEGLDILSSPSGPILAAQQLAAVTWGADATWFLVNGTTAGIHAAVMASCGPRAALILARNAHLSAFNAMVLAGCTPVYVQPCCDEQLGIAHHVTPATLEDAFQEAQRRGLSVGAVLIVSPTYFGVISDVAGLAAVCHSHGVPLLVDEAHGAHLGLHPELPPSALQSGADVVVQSTHKQLSAMTQAAMLHLQGSQVQRVRISRALQVLQSSSPSYLLMSSLDAARAQASDPAAHTDALAAARYARQQLEGLPGVQLLSLEQIRSSSTIGGAGSMSCISSRPSGNTAGLGKQAVMQHGHSRIRLDPLRLTISLQRLALTGYQVAAALEQQHGIIVELATPICVVLAMSIGSTQEHAYALVAALQQLSAQHSSSGSSTSKSRSSISTVPFALHAAPKIYLSPREAFFAAAEEVKAAQAVGRVSAELLCPYPPGVPAVYPGELITDRVLQQLQAVLRHGGTVTGCSNNTLKMLRVVVQ